MAEDPTLEAIARLAAVVDAGSLSAAARAEGTSKATLSRALKWLEEDLGVALLERRSTGVVPTSAGRAFLDRALPALDELRRARDEVRQSSLATRGRLRVACPPELAHGWVGPRIGAFLACHPEVSVEVEYASRVVDLVREGYDLAVRAERVRDPAVRARVMGRVSAWLVASPAFVAREGVPHDLAGLARASCLTLSAPGGNRWALLDAAGRSHVVEVRGRFASNELVASRDAALAGLGIARLPEWLVRQHVSGGSLVRVMPRWRSASRTYYLVVPAGRLPTRLRALADALVESSEPSTR
jgi:DNA-binding transcriptional LysR family regulator